MSYLSLLSGKADQWATQPLPPPGGTEVNRGRELAMILRVGLSEEVALSGVLDKGEGDSQAVMWGTVC